MLHFLLAILISIVATLATTPLVCDLIIYINGDITWPFSRILDRVLLFFVLLTLILFRKKVAFGLVKGMLQDEIKQGRIWPRLVCGFLLTAGSTLLVLPWIVSTSSLVWEPRTLAYFSTRIPKVILAGCVIALIEESFFRVLLLHNLKERFSLYIACALSSLLYAVVHFIKPFKGFQYDGNLLAGFVYLQALFERSVDVSLFISLAALFFVGCILCFVIERGKSLWLCMALHCGWVFGIKMARYTTTLPEGMSYPVGTGREYYLLNFYQAWLALIGVALILHFFRHKIFARDFV